MKITRDLLKKLILEEMNLSPINEEQMGLMDARAALETQFQAGGPYTVAMLSAENPPNPPPQWDNQAMMSDLEEDMEKQGLRYYPIMGQYFGAAENSFLVVNAPKASIIWLGKKYLQDSVIWGEKQRAMADEGAGANIYFRFLFIQCHPEETPKSEKYTITDEKDVILNDASIQGRDDMFSKIANEKFVIPFFTDPEMEYKANVRPEKIDNVDGRQIGGVYEVKGE
jgi:hypothetical protein|tara:strand:- start:5031 stop:5708 length:678 start_codon:yes stop_codon:yes gene_type:complete